MSIETVAIIGTGPSGYSALHALKNIPNCKITVFDSGPNLIGPHTIPFQNDDHEFYDNLYRQLKMHIGLKFPPQKSHFLNSLQNHYINGRKRFPVSNALGGLSNFWGATMLPLSPSELLENGLQYEDLKPFYLKVSELVGISGRHDQLSNFYLQEYSNRPSIPLLDGIQNLEKHLQMSGQTDYNVYSGVNRVALETRPAHINSCTLCGECLIGCRHNSIFNSKNDFQSNNGLNLIFEKVLMTRPAANKVSVSTKQSTYYFDKVFLCAGTFGTAEIIINSLCPTEELILHDNSICQMPLLNLSQSSAFDKSNYIALTQLISVLQKKNSADPTQIAQVQYYSNFDYIWRAAIPESIWPIFKPLIRFSRDRLIWSRLYTHSTFGWHYNIGLNSTGQISIKESQAPQRNISYGFYNALQTKLKNSPYFLMKFAPIFASTSSHLALQKPQSIKVDFNGELEKNIYVCDGAYFNQSPSTSLTFTIMANAYRIVHNACVEKG